MAERLKAPVLKTGKGATISYHMKIIIKIFISFILLIPLNAQAIDKFKGNKSPIEEKGESYIGDKVGYAHFGNGCNNIAGYVGDGRVIPHEEYRNVKPNSFFTKQDYTAICFHEFESPLGSKSIIISFSHQLRVPKKVFSSSLAINGKLKKKKGIKSEDGKSIYTTWKFKEENLNCLAFKQKYLGYSGSGFWEIGKICIKEDLNPDKIKYLVEYNKLIEGEEIFYIN